MPGGIHFQDYQKVQQKPAGLLLCRYHVYKGLSPRGPVALSHADITQHAT